MYPQSNVVIILYGQLWVVLLLTFSQLTGSGRSWGDPWGRAPLGEVLQLGLPLSLVLIPQYFLFFKDPVTQNRIFLIHT